MYRGPLRVGRRAPRGKDRSNTSRTRSYCADGGQLEKPTSVDSHHDRSPSVSVGVRCAVASIPGTKLTVPFTVPSVASLVKLWEEVCVSRKANFRGEESPSCGP